MLNSDGQEYLERRIFIGMRAQMRGRDYAMYEWRQGSLPRELIDAYWTTVYTVNLDGKEARMIIGEFSQDLDRYLAEHELQSWAIITAWNPRSQRLDDAENERRQALLEGTLSINGYQTLPARGQSPDGQWCEPSLFVPNADYDFIEALGAVFGQYAVVYGDIEGRAELLYVLDPPPKEDSGESAEPGG